MTYSGRIGGDPTWGQSVNDLGVAVGFTHGSVDHAFWWEWEIGNISGLGTLSRAHDINELGQVVGEGGLWDNGTITDLGTLGHAGVIADALNDACQVVGYGWTHLNGPQHAFLWDNGVITDLNDLIPPTSGWELKRAADINDVGQIVGTGNLNGGEHHAFLWENNTVTDLGTLGGYASAAWGINNLGQVVGISIVPGGPNWIISAFIWEDGVMTDLGSLGPSYDVFARDINDLGQVVGYCWMNPAGTGGEIPEPTPTPLQSHPNPTSGSLSIEFELAATAHVELAVFDVNGRLVRHLLGAPLEGGSYSMGWDGRDEAGRAVGAGTYFSRLGIDGEQQARRILVVR